jgi:sugar O-acyltransferase (sialic acid O-acetyltransferase NeuD family)
VVHKPIVIVGTGMQAELVEYHFGTQGRSTAAYVLDPEYLREDSFRGCPVLDFDTARHRFPPEDYDLFVSIGFTATAARKRWFLAAQAAGYVLPSFVHPNASVASNVRVGANTLIRDFAVVCPFVQLGDDIFIAPQVCVGHHCRVGSHNFVAAGAVLAGAVEIGEGCFIGVNATFRDRVRVGDGCIIGASALIMADCAPGGVYRAARSERLRELRG